MVNPPLPPITPPNVVLALERDKVFEPSVTVPVLAPDIVGIEIPPLAALIFRFPFATTVLLSIVPLPLNANDAPEEIVVGPV